MKYSQFVELKGLVESNGYSLSEWRTNKNLQLIKEADEKDKDEEDLSKDTESEDKDKLDTKKGNWLTKQGRMRSKLNNNAKVLSQGILKNIGEKYIKPLKNQRLEVFKKIIAMENVKTPQDVLKNAELKTELTNLKDLQKKQMDIIEKTAANIIKNTETKISSAINKSSMSDTAKANLLSYWQLLSMQIQFNLLKNIFGLNKDVLNELTKDPTKQKIVQAINGEISKDQIAQIKEKQQRAEATKNEIKQSDAKLEKEPEEKDATSLTGEDKSNKEKTSKDAGTENSKDLKPGENAKKDLKDSFNNSTGFKLLVESQLSK